MASKKHASPVPSSRPVTGCFTGGIYIHSKTIRLVVPCVTCISRNLFSFVSPPTWDAGSDVKTREAVTSISCRTCKELPDCRLRVFVRYFPGYGSLHVYPSDVWPYLLGRTKLGPRRHSLQQHRPDDHPTHSTNTARVCRGVGRTGSSAEHALHENEG
jgi:hypothetical protein